MTVEPNYQKMSYSEIQDHYAMKEQELVARLCESADILFDSGWVVDEKTSISGRGITDYNRTIVVSDFLSEPQIWAIENALKEINCPGWTGIRLTNVDNKLQETTRKVSYTFRTTWDSSD